MSKNKTKKVINPVTDDDLVNFVANSMIQNATLNDIIALIEQKAFKDAENHVKETMTQEEKVSLSKHISEINAKEPV